MATDRRPVEASLDRDAPAAAGQLGAQAIAGGALGAAEAWRAKARVSLSPGRSKAKRLRLWGAMAAGTVGRKCPASWRVRQIWHSWAGSPALPLASPAGLTRWASGESGARQRSAPAASALPPAKASGMGIMPAASWIS